MNDSVLTHQPDTQSVPENGDEILDQSIAAEDEAKAAIEMAMAHQAFLDKSNAEQWQKSRTLFEAGPRQKHLYQYDELGRLVAEVVLTESYGGADDFGHLALSTDSQPPHDHAVFDGQAWVTEGSLYDQAVEAAIKDKRLKINRARDQKIAEGFDFMDKVFDADDVSIQKINGASTMALIAKSTSAPFSIVWTTKDNSEIILTADEMIALGVACATHVDQLHHQCVQRKTQLMGLTSLEAIASFHWNSEVEQ